MVTVYQKGMGVNRKLIITGDFYGGYMLPAVHVEWSSFYLNAEGHLETELWAGAALLIMQHASPWGFQVVPFEAGDVQLVGWHDQQIYHALQNGGGLETLRTELI